MALSTDPTSVKTAGGGHPRHMKIFRDASLVAISSNAPVLHLLHTGSDDWIGSGSAISVVISSKMSSNRLGLLSFIICQSFMA